MSGPENFVLRSTVTSPFGRKVRMAIDVLGLSSRVRLDPADPLDEKDTLRRQNPLDPPANSHQHAEHPRSPVL